MFENLNIIEQSTNPILPLSLVKSQIRQDITVSTLDDMLIGVYLRAATAMAEAYLKRTLDTKSYSLVVDYFPGYNSYRGTGHPGQAYASRAIYGFPFNWDSFRLPKPPLISVDSITFNATNNANTVNVPSTDYVYVAGTPGRVGPAYGQIFPFSYGWNLGQIGSVQIQYTAGYGIPDPVNGLLGILPDNITAGILLLTANLYENREATTDGSKAVLPFGVKELFDTAFSGYYK